MDEPWFDPATFGTWFGVIVGGGVGTLCGVWGTLCGILLPRGKGRKLILGGIIMFGVLGLSLCAFGLIAIFSGQPYGICYPVLLTGVVLAVISGVLFPRIRKNYEQAENRRIAAESIRLG